MATKEEILDSIATMTVLELSELLKEFEEKFGVTAAAPVAAVAAPATAAGLIPSGELNVPNMPFLPVPLPQQVSFPGDLAALMPAGLMPAAKAAAVPEPKVEEAKETDAKDKLLAAATASYDFCGEALGKMDDSKLGDTIELFGGRQGPRAMAALILASGWADHYSTAAMYLRLNGILPPSAQPKK